MFSVPREAILLEDTGGRGYHIWVFFSEAVEGRRFNQPNNFGFYSAGVTGARGRIILILKDLLIFNKKVFFNCFFVNDSFQSH